MKCKFFYVFEKRSFFDKYPDAKLVNFSVAIKFEKFPGVRLLTKRRANFDAESD